MIYEDVLLVDNMFEIHSAREIYTRGMFVSRSKRRNQTDGISEFFLQRYCMAARELDFFLLDLFVGIIIAITIRQSGF